MFKYNKIYIEQFFKHNSCLHFKNYSWALNYHLRKQNAKNEWYVFASKLDGEYLKDTCINYRSEYNQIFEYRLDDCLLYKERFIKVQDLNNSPEWNKINKIYMTNKASHGKDLDLGNVIIPKLFCNEYPAFSLYDNDNCKLDSIDLKYIDSKFDLNLNRSNKVGSKIKASKNGITTLNSLVWYNNYDNEWFEIEGNLYSFSAVLGNMKNSTLMVSGSVEITGERFDNNKIIWLDEKEAKKIEPEQPTGEPWIEFKSAIVNNLSLICNNSSNSNALDITIDEDSEIKNLNITSDYVGITPHIRYNKELEKPGAYLILNNVKTNNLKIEWKYSYPLEVRISYLEPLDKNKKIYFNVSTSHDSKKLVNFKIFKSFNDNIKTSFHPSHLRIEEIIEEEFEE